MSLTLARVAIFLACFAVMGATCDDPDRPDPPIDPTDTIVSGCPNPERANTELGQLLRERCPVTPVTEDDYGQVTLVYTPPSAGSVVRAEELQRTWRSRIDQALWPDVRSAAVLMEVYIRGQGGEVRIATVPLTTFSFSDSDPETKTMTISTDRDFRDGPVTARFLIDDSQTSIFVRTRVAFSTATRARLVERLTLFAGAAADFGGHGWAVDALANEEVRSRLQQIEELFVGPAFSITENIRTELSYRPGAFSALQYEFTLDPQTGRRYGFGRLNARLTRDATVFSNASVVNGRLNYGISEEGEYDRFYRFEVSTRATPPAAQYVRDFLNTQIDSTPSQYGAFVSDQSSAAAFETACNQVWARLGTLGLSPPDRRALFWALVFDGPNGRKAANWANPNGCLGTVHRQSQSYGLLFPQYQRVAPVVDTETRDEWFEQRVALGLALAPGSAERLTLLKSLFAPEPFLSFEPDTILAANLTPPANSRASSVTVAGMLDQVDFDAGCRFAASAEGVQPQQMSFLLRRTDRNQLLVATAYYEGRTTGLYRVHMTGFEVRNPTTADQAALAAQPGLAQRCRDLATAPAGPAAARPPQ